MPHPVKPTIDQQADIGEFWASLEKALLDMGDDPSIVHCGTNASDLSERVTQEFIDWLEKRNPSVLHLRKPIPKCALEDIAREFASSGLRFTYVPPVKK
jgi:hypothetical protein